MKPRLVIRNGKLLQWYDDLFPLGLRTAVKYDSTQDPSRTGRELLYSSVNQFPLIQPVFLLSWVLTSWALSGGFPAHSLSLVQNPFPKEPKIQGMEEPYSLTFLEKVFWVKLIYASEKLELVSYDLGEVSQFLYVFLCYLTKGILPGSIGNQHKAPLWYITNHRCSVQWGPRQVKFSL